MLDGQMIANFFLVMFARTKELSRPTVRELNTEGRAIEHAFCRTNLS